VALLIESTNFHTPIFEVLHTGKRSEMRKKDNTKPGCLAMNLFIPDDTIN
jgi:hypothetical protein